MNRAEAQKHISETCGQGWFTLVEILYDNKPESIEITAVFQKWAGLKVDYEGEDVHFEELAETVYSISQKMCEKCGASGNYTMIDGWETTLCNRHYAESEAKQKYREEK